MPTPNREPLLCRYHYDPLDRLDRLVNSTPFEQPTQRFYCKTRLSCEIQGTVQRSVVQYNDQLLAQLQPEAGKVVATLLATDQQRSVLNALDANQPNPFAYSPYGHRPPQNGLLSLLGFNGERPDPVTGHYHLGNGYRQFNPVLMRFNSPDSWSPFGEGGLNAYAYCEGNPVNRTDPTGHVGDIIKGILNLAGRRPQKVKQQLAMYRKLAGEFPERLNISKVELDRLGHESAKQAMAIQKEGFRTDMLSSDLTLKKTNRPFAHSRDYKNLGSAEKLERLENVKKNRNIHRLSFSRKTIATEIYQLEDFVKNYDKNLEALYGRIKTLEERNIPFSTELDFIRSL